MTDTSNAQQSPQATWGALQWVGAVVAWLWVIVPFCYGLYQLIVKIPALFGS